MPRYKKIELALFLLIKSLFSLCFVLFVSQICVGQKVDTCKLSPLPSNSVFFEFGGNSGFFGSVNYERKIFNKKSFYLTGRAGIGYGHFPGYMLFSAPVIITGVVRVFRKLSYELGAGILLMRIGNLGSGSGYGWAYKNDFAPTALIGVRFQSKSGFLFRFDFTPIYTNFNIHETRKNLYPFFGVSFGYGFGVK